MAYEFSMDKGTGIILVVGYGLVGLLLFLAGFLLGIEDRTSLEPESMVAKAEAAKADKTAPEKPAGAAAEQSSEAVQPPVETVPGLTPVLNAAPEDESPADALPARGSSEASPPCPQRFSKPGLYACRVIRVPGRVRPRSLRDRGTWP
jgi:hypothetical protein